MAAGLRRVPPRDGEDWGYEPATRLFLRVKDGYPMAEEAAAAGMVPPPVQYRPRYMEHLSSERGSRSIDIERVKMGEDPVPYRGPIPKKMICAHCRRRGDTDECEGCGSTLKLF